MCWSYTCQGSAVDVDALLHVDVLVFYMRVEYCVGAEAAAASSIAPVKLLLLRPLPSWQLHPPPAVPSLHPEPAKHLS